MINFILSTLFILVTIATFSKEQINTDNIKIIFGSCSNQNSPMPHWKHISTYNPGHLFLLGDNVYGDFNDPEANNLKMAYSKLNNNIFFLNLKKNIKIYPVWDDHDYGLNDGGKDWVFKKLAQKLFLDFYNVDKNDARRKRGGIYHSWNIIKKNINIKVIALDTRFFKDNFKKNYDRKIRKKYIPDYDEEKTILGIKQWTWLKEEINEKYDVLFILSSIQLIPEEHGWEKWYNFPHERKKILELIKNNRKLSIILSGDRHFGAMYKYNKNIYEITSSSFNKSILNYNEKDRYSLGEIIHQNNFGLININTRKRSIELQLRAGTQKENKVFKKLRVNF